MMTLKDTFIQRACVPAVWTNVDQTTSCFTWSLRSVYAFGIIVYNAEVPWSLVRCTTRLDANINRALEFGSVRSNQ